VGVRVRWAGAGVVSGGSAAGVAACVEPEDPSGAASAEGDRKHDDGGAGVLGDADRGGAADPGREKPDRGGGGLLAGVEFVMPEGCAEAASAGRRLREAMDDRQTVGWAGSWDAVPGRGGSCDQQPRTRPSGMGGSGAAVQERGAGGGAAPGGSVWIW